MSIVYTLRQVTLAGAFTLGLGLTGASAQPAVDMAGEGLNIAEGGVGLGGDFDPRNLPNSITIDIPGDPVQALLYWGGFMNEIGAPGDGDLLFGGDAVAGALTGTEAVAGDLVFGFVADVTSTVQAAFSGAGNYVFDLADGNAGDDADRLHGAGLLVIYEDAGSPGQSRVIVVEGADFAFEPFAGTPAGETDPVSFSYPSASADRSASYVVFGGAGLAEFTDRIDVSDNGSIFDSFDGSDGQTWDTDVFSIAIPAGASETTTQVFSDGASPDSIFWVAQALRLSEDGKTPEMGKKKKSKKGKKVAHSKKNKKIDKKASKGGKKVEHSKKSDKASKGGKKSSKKSSKKSDKKKQTKRW